MFSIVLIIVNRTVSFSPELSLVTDFCLLFPRTHQNNHSTEELVVAYTARRFSTMLA